MNKKIFKKQQRCPQMAGQAPQMTGQAAITAVLIMLTVMLGGIFAISSASLKEAKIANENAKSRYAFFSSEAGVDDAIYRLKRGKNLSSSYSITLNGAVSNINVSTVSSLEKKITSSGDFSGSVRAVNADITAGVGVSFFYGVQVGDGGLTMGNNSTVNGNVYSDGNITGSSGALVTGSATVAGGVASDPSVDWTTQDSDFFFANISSNRDAAQSFTANASDRLNRVSVFLGKVGNPSGNITLKIAADNGGKPSTNNIASVVIPSSSVGATPSWIDVSFSSPPNLTNNTKYWIVLDYGSNSSSNYWNWRKDGSDAYANNTGKYTSDCCSGNPTWSNAGGDLNFRVWIGGVNTKIDGITIGNASSGEGHANLFVNTTVHGSSCPNQYCVVENPPREEMPISEGVIQDWKNAAAAGGTCAPPVCDSSGNLNVSGTKTIGPLKIPGTLTVTDGATLIVSGTVWVVGGISFSNNCIVKLTPGYGGSSGVVLSDGNIDVSNNCTFSGSGSPGSYIMLLSEKNAPTQDIIDVSNNSIGVIYYANNGKIEFSNNASAKEATAYGIDMSNNSTITYESGLANSNFSSGPGGGWNINSWKEVIP